MDIMERINTLRNCDFSTPKDYGDLSKIVTIFTKRYGIDITEENAGVMITHMAAAFKRNRTKEAIEPLGELLFEQVAKSSNYLLAVDIMNEIASKISNAVSENERQYFLLHICNVLENILGNVEK